MHDRFVIFAFMLLVAGCQCPAKRTMVLTGETDKVKSHAFAPHTDVRLEEYLLEPRFDQLVEELARIGIANYQKEPLKSLRANAKANDIAGGGRRARWLEATFNYDEADMISMLSARDAPEVFEVHDIDSTYRKYHRENDAHMPTFILVKGMGISYLHDYPLGQNAIVQLASQFNFLESPSSKKVPVRRYVFDKTQGPRGSIEAAAATLHREAAEESGKLPHALVNVVNTKAYSNGYLEVAKFPDDEQNQILKQIDENIGKLRILPQWVINEASGAVQLQVFAAAPSYQGKKTPKPGPIGEKICDGLVVPQYRAIAELAVIRSVLINTEVRLHLTLVGQGVFRNPVSTLQKALREVAEVVRGFPRVKVFIHAFSEHSQERVRTARDASAWSMQEWSAEQFKAAK